MNPRALFGARSLELGRPRIGSSHFSSQHWHQLWPSTWLCITHLLRRRFQHADICNSLGPPLNTTSASNNTKLSSRHASSSAIVGGGKFSFSPAIDFLLVSASLMLGFLAESLWLDERSLLLLLTVRRRLADPSMPRKVPNTPCAPDDTPASACSTAFGSRGIARYIFSLPVMEKDSGCSSTTPSSSFRLQMRNFRPSEPILPAAATVIDLMMSMRIVTFLSVSAADIGQS
mmetsp:Transcript_11484/g.28683  ORF Transcript_11484/g.28683 Transcript_11484/m.28683 type:complete len:231 (-) Transcript_11484:703-1395(-)